MRHLDDLEQELRARISLGISLEPLGDGRYAVLTPFTFDDGDRFPVVLAPRNGGWRITDEGSALMHLSYDDYAIEEGNRARLIENIALRHDLELIDWELAREIGDAPTASDVLGFIHAIARISDVGHFLARDVVASTFNEDFRQFLRESVASNALTFDFHDPEHDPDGNYRSDAALHREGAAGPLLTFAVSSDSRAKDATIALLTFEHWEVDFGSMAVAENQAGLSRRPLAQLTDVVDKQFASLHGNEDRIRSYLRDQGVPVLTSPL
jgi:hypothetical protein